jgi:hypothetical protein
VRKSHLRREERQQYHELLSCLLRPLWAHLFDSTGEGGTPMKRKQVVAKETTYETGQCFALAARAGNYAPAPRPG